jgi:LSD1 subclass zinc finger protein
MTSHPISLDFHGDLARRMREYRDPHMDDLDRLCKLSDPVQKPNRTETPLPAIVDRSACIDCREPLESRGKRHIRCSKCAYEWSLERNRRYRVLHRAAQIEDTAAKLAARECLDCRVSIADYAGQARRCRTCAAKRESERHAGYQRERRKAK